MRFSLLGDGVSPSLTGQKTYSYLPHQEKSPNRLTPKFFFLPPKVHPPLNKTVKTCCSHCSCTIFILPSYSLHTQVMLILILIYVQYLQNIVFSFEKGLSGQNHSLSDFSHPIEKSPQANFLSSYPLTLFGKSWAKGPSSLKFVCLFQVKFSFSIDNNFFQSSIMT